MENAEVWQSAKQLPHDGDTTSKTQVTCLPPTCPRISVTVHVTAPAAKSLLTGAEPERDAGAAVKSQLWNLLHLKQQRRK